MQKDLDNRYGYRYTYIAYMLSSIDPQQDLQEKINLFHLNLIMATAR